MAVYHIVLANKNYIKFFYINEINQAWPVLAMLRQTRCIWNQEGWYPSSFRVLKGWESQKESTNFLALIKKAQLANVFSLPAQQGGTHVVPIMVKCWDFFLGGGSKVVFVRVG